jgi:hypothetical protein
MQVFHSISRYIRCEEVIKASFYGGENERESSDFELE